MKVDFSTKIIDYKGKPILMREEDEATGRIVIVPNTFQTLGDIALMALGNPQDEKIDGREKIMRAKLGLLVASDEQPVELKVDDAKKIKDLIGKTMLPLQALRAEEIIDAAFASEPDASTKS